MSSHRVQTYPLKPNKGVWKAFKTYASMAEALSAVPTSVESRVRFAERKHTAYLDRRWYFLSADEDAEAQHNIGATAVAAKPSRELIAELTLDMVRIIDVFSTQAAALRKVHGAGPYPANLADNPGISNAIKKGHECGGSRWMLYADVPVEMREIYELDHELPDPDEWNSTNAQSVRRIDDATGEVRVFRTLALACAEPPKAGYKFKANPVGIKDAVTAEPGTKKFNYGGYRWEFPTAAALAVPAALEVASPPTATIDPTATAADKEARAAERRAGGHDMTPTWERPANWATSWTIDTIMACYVSTSSSPPLVGDDDDLTSLEVMGDVYVVEYAGHCFVGQTECAKYGRRTGALDAVRDHWSNEGATKGATALNAALARHGPPNFTWRIAERVPLPQLVERVAHWIRELRALIPNRGGTGYNVELRPKMLTAAQTGAVAARAEGGADGDGAGNLEGQDGGDADGGGTDDEMLPPEERAVRSRKGIKHRVKSTSEPGEIYMFRNKHNGKRYIGQTFSFLPDGRPYGTQGRAAYHFSSALAGTSKCTALAAAIRKHGKDMFEVETLLRCGSDELDEYEIKFIAMYNSTVAGGRGYNIESGGNAAGRMSDATRALKSARMTGDKHPMYGKHHTQAAKDKIATANLAPERHDVDGCILPKYIKVAVDDRKGMPRVPVGYMIVSHPALASDTQSQPREKFTCYAATTESMQRMRGRCLGRLVELDATMTSQLDAAKLLQPGDI